MIDDIFFKRFTVEELTKLKAYIEKIKKQRESKFPSEIKESDISIRCKDFLLGLDIDSWAQLEDISENEIKRAKNIGAKIVREVNKELKKRGLKLKTER
ncbi:DNA-directed RNA polymerase subunit alpha C-terminal domain-containing protein [uncultured Roseivirga sp.]|uniref:DNA-directed RNA polymerase subunit alpha C-terminal domain-containing protein n=1 Tax=uncultured Roseivirga sp. TaxID=543088 RepID=UPI0030D95DBB|tara:strand:+ start:7667 stop:7963 length:297 start_codon:yes stop_codon:yes gene_type:complete